MPEEFKKAIFSISNEEGLPSQNYKCYQCDTPIGIIYGPAAVCCFTGKYYCSKCHINDVSQKIEYFILNQHSFFCYLTFLEIGNTIKNDIQLGFYDAADLSKSTGIPIACSA